MKVLPSLRSPRESCNDPIAQRLKVSFGLDQKLLIRIIRTSNEELTAWRHRPRALLHQVAAVIRVGEVEQHITRGLSSGHHTDRGCPPLCADSPGDKWNRALESIIHASADDLCSPRVGSEDLIERLRVRRSLLRPLLNKHVQLTPHDVDEQLDAPGFHEIRKQLRRNLESVRVHKEECRRHSSAFSLQVAEDRGHLAEGVALAGLDIHTGRHWLQCREFLLKSSEIRRITLDE